MGRNDEKIPDPLASEIVAKMAENHEKHVKTAQKVDFENPLLGLFPNAGRKFVALQGFFHDGKGYSRLRGAQTPKRPLSWRHADW